MNLILNEKLGKEYSNKAQMQSFTQKVLKIVKGIPKGKVLTYGEVAERAGNPKAFRVVGSIMKGNYDPTIPCHRVVLKNSKLSGDNIYVGDYNRGGSKAKIVLLQKEKVLKIK
jgi:O-6-methylguanine DNA methyltransferase